MEKGETDNKERKSQKDLDLDSNDGTTNRRNPSANKPYDDLNNLRAR
jgi:hypothetical protein